MRKATSDGFQEMYLEKKVKKYLMVSPDFGSYLCKTKYGPNPEYTFVDDVVLATKTKTRDDAKFLIRCYREDTGDNLDLVVIPLVITYELINEVDVGAYDEDAVIKKEVVKKRWRF